MKSIPFIGTRVILTGLWREAGWMEDFLNKSGVVTRIESTKSANMRWVEVQFDDGSTHGIYICNLSLTTLIRRP